MVDPVKLVSAAESAANQAVQTEEAKATAWFTAPIPMWWGFASMLAGVLLGWVFL